MSLLPSIKEKDRIPADDRLPVAVLGILLTVIGVGLNIAFYTIWYIVAYARWFVTVGLFCTIRACFRIYKGNIRVEEGYPLPDTICPQCGTQGRFECFDQVVDGPREAHARAVNPQTSRTTKVYWERKVHCRLCGYIDYHDRIAQATQNTPEPSNDKPATKVEIQQLLSNEQFAEAERMLRDLLNKSPEDLDLMEYLLVALEGQNIIMESEELAKEIQLCWSRQKRTQWIAQGKPKQGSAFSRLVLNDSKGSYKVLAKQYFEPEEQQTHHHDRNNGLVSAYAHYKILATPKSSKSGLPCRLFKLVMSRSGTTLREHFQSAGHRDLKLYTIRRVPDIRLVANDVLGLLLSEETNANMDKSYMNADKDAIGTRGRRVGYQKVDLEDVSEESKELTECEDVLEVPGGEYSSSTLMAHFEIV